MWHPHKLHDDDKLSKKPSQLLVLSRTHNMEQIFYLTGLSKKERRRASVNNCEIDFSATSFITNPRTMSVRLETRVAIILTRHIRTVFQNVPKNESNMIFLVVIFKHYCFLRSASLIAGQKLKTFYLDSFSLVLLFL